MNKLRKFPQKVFLVLVAIMLSVLPNINVYSSVGTYNTSSDALVANTEYDADAGMKTVANWRLAALGLSFALGVIDGWNSIHPEELSINETLEEEYNATDFTEFDN